MNLVLQILGTAFSLYGVTLNVFKRRACWIFYFIGNSIWIWLYLRVNLKMVACLMLAYQVLAVSGWIRWRK